MDKLRYKQQCGRQYWIMSGYGMLYYLMLCCVWRCCINKLVYKKKLWQNYLLLQQQNSNTFLRTTKKICTHVCTSIHLYVHSHVRTCVRKYIPGGQPELSAWLGIVNFQGTKKSPFSSSYRSNAALILSQPNKTPTIKQSEIKTFKVME